MSIPFLLVQLRQILVTKLSLLTVSKRWLTATTSTCNLKADTLGQRILIWLTVTDDKVQADIRLP